MRKEPFRHAPAEFGASAEILRRQHIRPTLVGPSKRLRRIVCTRSFLTTLSLLAFVVAAIPLRASQRQAADASSSSQATRAKIEHYLRERFSVSPAATITVGPLEPSIYPGFLRTTVTVENGKQKSAQDFFVSRDGAYLVQGSIFGLNGDPDREVERQIDMNDQPSEGPAAAPVTIVEYADLECPHCAAFQQFFDKDFLPKYGSRVRLVFKEFPLYTIHPWSVQAAVADECAFEINPADFLPYRSLIFQNQSAIKTDTVRVQLLDLGAQAGLDRQKLAACYDAKQTLTRVRADVLEGERLGVNTTPTLFVNGKMVVGDVSPADFYKIVDEALAAATGKSQAAPLAHGY